MKKLDFSKTIKNIYKEKESQTPEFPNYILQNKRNKIIQVRLFRILYFNVMARMGAGDYCSPKQSFLV